MTDTNEFRFAVDVEMDSDIPTEDEIVNAINNLEDALRQGYAIHGFQVKGVKKLDDD